MHKKGKLGIIVQGLLASSYPGGVGVKGRNQSLTRDIMSQTDP